MKIVATALFGALLGLVFAEGVLRLFDWGDCQIFRTDERYGYLMGSDQWVSTRGHRFYINHYGLRGPDFAARREIGTDRIAFIGDSITFAGGRIAEKDIFVNRAAALIAADTRRRVEPINVSAPGWGVQNIDAYVRTVGIHDADIVVWVLPSVDFRRPKTTVDDHDFPLNKPALRLSCLFRFVLKLCGNVMAEWRGRGNTDRIRSKVLAENLDAFSDALTKIKQDGATVGVVFLPSARDNPQTTADLVAYRTKAEHLNVPIFDLGPEFVKNDEKKLFYDGFHPGEQGHKLIGQQVAQFVESFWKPEHTATGVAEAHGPQSGHRDVANH